MLEAGALREETYAAVDAICPNNPGLLPCCCDGAPAGAALDGGDAAVLELREGCWGGAKTGLFGAAAGRAGARPPEPPRERGILREWIY